MFEKVEKKSGHLAGIVNYIRRNASYPVKEQKHSDNDRLKKDEEQYFGVMKEAIGKEEKYLAGSRAFEGKNLGFVRPYADSPMDEVHTGEDVYISMAEAAEKYAWFITPYLIITDEMCHAFALAARRGVDVRIITPGIPDKKIVYSVTRSYYNGLARHGSGFSNIHRVSVTPRCRSRMILWQRAGRIYASRTDAAEIGGAADVIRIFNEYSTA